MRFIVNIYTRFTHNSIDFRLTIGNPIYVSLMRKYIYTGVKIG